MFNELIKPRMHVWYAASAKNDAMRSIHSHTCPEKTCSEVAMEGCMFSLPKLGRAAEQGSHSYAHTTSDTLPPPL
jgi:hypothetical protein